MNDASDVLALMPKEYRDPDSAPVRDALVAGEVAMQVAWQDAAAYAASQADIGRATDQYIDGLAEDRGYVRSGSESVDDFRARVLSIPELVTPASIADIVNAILARLGAGECQIAESISDRTFISDGVSVPSAFIGADPFYDERAYEVDAAAHGGVFRPNSSPGGARIFGNSIGRLFQVRLPDLSPLDSSMATIFDGSGGEWELSFGFGTFIGDGVAPSSRGFVYSDSSTALDAYGAIADAVEAARGHSIRWQFVTDPRL